MANDLGDAISRATTNLDTILNIDTRTADLNMNQDLLGEFTGNGEIQIPLLDMDGLGDKVRGGGFTPGGLKLDWYTMKLEFEREREFEIDVLDDEERELIVSVNAMAEFARNKVVPEVDAIRFARLCANAGTTVSAALTTADATAKAVETAEAAMEDIGVELSQCILYLTSATRLMLRQAQPYQIGQGEAPNTIFQTFDGMKMVTVPLDRFYTAIDLADGRSTGEKEGGYSKNKDAKGINFMVVHPSACGAITKHKKLRYFTPDQHQKDETHLWQYRLYHDLLVYKNQKPKIYLHAKTA